MTKKLATEIPTTLDFAIDSCALFELLDDGESKPLTKARRKEMLREVRQGEPHELQVEALVYQQSTTPRPLPKSKAREANSNNYYFAPNILASLTRSYRGRVFLRDHSRHELDAVGGEITASELVEEKGWLRIRQTLRLISRWAVEGALGGTLRTFSIGWDIKKRGRGALRDALFCTVCSKKIMSSDCPHFPGDDVILDDGENHAIVEIEWRSAIGAETSAVSFPAVAGTQIETVRAALAESRSEIIKESNPMTDAERKDLAKRAEILGLPSDATVEQVLDAAAALNKKYIAELAAAETARDSAVKSLDAERAQHADADAERKRSKIASLRDDAIKRGLMAIDDDSDKLFATLAESDTALAERFIGTLRPATPVGRPMQSENDPARPEPKGGDKVEKILADEFLVTDVGFEAPILKSQLAQLGLTPEDFEKHGQHTVGRVKED